MKAFWKNGLNTGKIKEKRVSLIIFKPISKYELACSYPFHMWRSRRTLM
jgi:hypothetical protein